MVGVVPPNPDFGCRNHQKFFRFVGPGVESEIHSGSSDRGVEIEKFPGIEPATTVPEDTHLTAMLSLHATNDHQSYLNHIVKILMYLR